MGNKRVIIQKPVDRGMAILEIPPNLPFPGYELFFYKNGVFQSTVKETLFPESTIRIQKTFQHHSVPGCQDLIVQSGTFSSFPYLHQLLFALFNDLHQFFRGKIRSEEHTSELQSLMRTSYAGFCLKK